MDEQVFVVRRGDLFPAGRQAPAGFEPGDGQPYLERIGRSGFFARRAAAETDPSLKQIIPYGVVSAGQLVFLMRRTGRGGESRLHGRWSIGVGGHINPVDGPPPAGEPEFRLLAPRDGAALTEAAFRRELAEELEVETPLALSVAGVLNDDSNPVGEVHFGIVFEARAAEPWVRAREAGELEGRFVPAEDLWALRGRMETWSRFLVERLWPEGVRPGGA